MANKIYPKFKESIGTESDTDNGLTGTGTSGVWVALIKTGAGGYTYSDSHQYYSSLAGVLGTDQEITSPTFTNGIFKGDDTTWTAVAAGDTISAVVFYRKNTGSSTTWRLISYLDTNMGLPLSTNDGDIKADWDSNGIFGL